MTGRSPMPELDINDPTRVKLLEAAAQVFSEHGFEAATIREICTRAEANVAAINYHFRDKLGLYTEVLRTSVTGIHSPPKLPDVSNPEEALRSFISVFLVRMSGSSDNARRLRIVVHELANPSPALPQVIDQLMRPNYDRLRAIVAAIIGQRPDHTLTRLCAHSIIGQIVHYTHARPVIAVLWPELKMTPKNLSRIADHIADFSLCSLRRTARKTKNKQRKL